LTMNDDIELGAIAKLIGVLEPLSEKQRDNVLAYVLARFSTTRPPGVAPVKAAESKAKGLTSKRRSKTRVVQTDKGATTQIDIAKLVNELKDSDEFSTLEKTVLDQPDLLRRILLALDMYRKVYGEAGGMTSGEIARFYGQLNIKIGVPNVSTALSDRASNFVMTDQVRTKGAILRYRLSRSGTQAATDLTKVEAKKKGEKN
jgi:hypothetical protein